MSRVLTPTLQRRKNCLLRKHRELSLPGQMQVKVGDQVKASQIVAKAEFPGDLSILRITEHLGIDASEVKSNLKVKEGDEIVIGQVICEYKGLFGLFKNSYKSELSGKIEFINNETGHIGLRLPSKVISLNAYISGTVSSIEGKKALTIDTNCSFIQGIFGVGGEQQGRLKALNVKPDAKIGVSDIPQEVRGCILFGGTCPDAAALKRAGELGAVGFITGSIDDKSLAAFLGYDIGIALTGNEDISMTLILTEGFGNLAFSDAALHLLKEAEGMEASINGATQVRAGALRPEIIIPLQSGDKNFIAETVQEEGVLDIGSNIRIIREPYFGKLAKVVEMPFKPEKVDTGAEVRVLRAEIQGQGVVTVPRANVEIL